MDGSGGRLSHIYSQPKYKVEIKSLQEHGREVFLVCFGEGAGQAGHVMYR